jgi:hypothetical protein
MSLVAARGCDLMVASMVKDMEDRGILKPVATGPRLYPWTDTWDSWVDTGERRGWNGDMVDFASQYRYLYTWINAKIITLNQF